MSTPRFLAPRPSGTPTREMGVISALFMGLGVAKSVAWYDKRMKFEESIFKAYDVRGKVGPEVTPELTEAIGRALADWLPTEGAVAGGYDMGPDSQELAGA